MNKSKEILSIEDLTNKNDSNIINEIFGSKRKDEIISKTVGFGNESNIIVKNVDISKNDKSSKYLKKLKMKTLLLEKFKKIETDKMKLHYLIKNKENEIEDAKIKLIIEKLDMKNINYSNETTQEELAFIYNPKKLIFDSKLFRACNNSRAELYFIRDFDYYCHSHDDNCEIIYFNNNGIFYKKYIHTINLSYFANLLIGPLTKAFLTQFMILLSKNYPTIETYVICPRYLRNGSEKNNNLINYKANTYILVPLNLLYSDLPFLHEYNKYLQTIHSYKNYKIKVYPSDSYIKELINIKIYDYVCEKKIKNKRNDFIIGKNKVLK